MGVEPKNKNQATENVGPQINGGTWPTQTQTLSNKQELLPHALLQPTVPIPGSQGTFRQRVALPSPFTKLSSKAFQEMMFGTTSAWIWIQKGFIPQIHDEIWRVFRKNIMKPWILGCPIFSNDLTIWPGGGSEHRSILCKIKNIRWPRRLPCPFWGIYMDL